MTELLTSPPPASATARLTSIDGVRVAPTVLAVQDGVEGQCGPEAAGALLLLQATFTDADRAAQFWDRVADLMELLATAPGFIRRYNFADGGHFTLLALWRTAADADAFFAGTAHQDAMRDLYAERWQHTHFAGLWEQRAPRQRVIFCDTCTGVTSASEAACRGCGHPQVDPYTGAQVRA